MSEASVRTAGYFAVLLVACLGCGGSVPRAEYDKLQTQLREAERELEEYRNGAPRLLALAEDALEAQRYEAAEESAQKILNLHPQASEAENAKVILAKAQQGVAELKLKRARAEEKAKKEEERSANQARAERERRIASATKSLRKSVDDVQGTTFYGHKDAPRYLNSRTDFGVYFAAVDGDAQVLRLRIQYVARDWIFIERFIIKADEQVFRIEPSYGQIKRDNGSGEIWEWYDAPVGFEEQKILTAMLAAKKVTIRFEGSQYRKDRTLSKGERGRLEEVLTAYRAMRSNT